MSQFSKDVIEGLSSMPKELSSKYFYDELGDSLFQAIMHLDEYYLTKSEFEIFSSNKARLTELFSSNCDTFNLIEFGAGDGLKTKVLLKHMVETGVDFTYIPIDISQNAINKLEASLKDEIPMLKVDGVVNEYFGALEEISKKNQSKNVILFLGSNIGNFNDDLAHDFLSQINKSLKGNDLLLIGFDLKKNPKKILAAYNDKQGITKAFNLNLLSRINKEFEGDFDLGKFDHYPMYNPINGECRSFIISLAKQQVTLKKLNKSFDFALDEPIFMEISRKYDLQHINNLALKTQFRVKENIFDCKHFFVDSIWEIK
ncbi:MAG: L-histidine N-alpha-methyltransferase [Sphingobacteriales bacterium]|jgi:L-histidine N-alpha-methyltransferase